MTGFVPLHDKEHFYKYYNAEATKLVLRNLAVKWSSPALFNDPFDLQINLDFGFDLDEVDKFFYEETSRIVFSDDDPEGDMSVPLFAILMQLRADRKKGKFTKEEFKKLATGLEKNAEEIKEVLNEGAVWWREFANDTRVFCVTEIHDDLLMWAHYADNHRGCLKI